MAAIAAVTLKRPARFVLTREVDTSTTGHRCLVEIHNVTSLTQARGKRKLPTQFQQLWETPLSWI